MTIEQLQKIVDIQAEDEGLWFMAQYASEAYLQAALRKLHAAIEELVEDAPPIVIKTSLNDLFACVRADAYEECAKIAEGFIFSNAILATNNMLVDVAAKIRSRAKEIK